VNDHVRYRPHHFLCTLEFEGKGYSLDFAANMSAIVVDRLRAKNGDKAAIEVTASFDDIRAPCPKNQGHASAA
jgi:hypothetical protein